MHVGCVSRTESIGAQSAPYGSYGDSNRNSPPWFRLGVRGRHVGCVSRTEPIGAQSAPYGEGTGDQFWPASKMGDAKRVTGTNLRRVVVQVRQQEGHLAVFRCPGPLAALWKTRQVPGSAGILCVHDDPRHISSPDQGRPLAQVPAGTVFARPGAGPGGTGPGGRVWPPDAANWSLG